MESTAATKALDRLVDLLFNDDEHIVIAAATAILAHEAGLETARIHANPETVKA